MIDLLSADSVTVNGQSASFSHADNQLQVSVPAYGAGDSIRIVDIYYHGLGKNAGDVQGIFHKYNSANQEWVTWTLSESFHSQSWFPCKQELQDKADSAYVFLSTDKTLKAGSNGLLTNTVDLPGNRVRYEWKCRYPIDYYLISFAVANYRDYSFYVKNGDNDSLLIQNYIYNNDAYFQQNKSLIDETGKMIALYDSLFIQYPFSNEKYGHCVAPSGGGMEHQTMTTLVNFSFLLVAHELFHQWFGDYVTCKTWQDIWVNEGFASYAEYLVQEFLHSKAEADNWMVRTQSYVKNIPGGSVYVPESSATNEDRIFDYRLTYAKGAAIIHMMRQEAGNDALFFSVLKEYLNRYKNSTATGNDVRDLFTEMTGKDFTAFFQQWYTGEGFPTLDVNWDHQHDTLYVNALETTSSTVTPFFNLLVEYKINIDGRDTIISHRQEAGLENWQVYLPGNVTSVIVDPNHWLLMEVAGISRINYHEKQTRFVVIPNPARDMITLNFTGPVQSYTVHLADDMGRILYTERGDKNEQQIDVGRFAKGMYFVIVNENKTIYQSRFIKN